MDLATYLKTKNDECRAAAANDPSITMLILPVEDVAFWNEQGIFTVEQYVRDGLMCEFSDAYKSAHGFRPRGYDLSGWTNEQIEAEIKSLYAYANAHAEQEAEDLRSWMAEQEKVEAEVKAEDDWSKWQHYYDRLCN